MSWQDFMFASIGVSLLVLSAAIVYTLSRTWETLDNVKDVSEDVKKTGHLALDGPVRGILKLINIFSPKGGEKRDQRS